MIKPPFPGLCRPNKIRIVGQCGGFANPPRAIFRIAKSEPWCSAGDLSIPREQLFRVARFGLTNPNRGRGGGFANPPRAMRVLLIHCPILFTLPIATPSGPYTDSGIPSPDAGKYWPRNCRRAAHSLSSCIPSVEFSASMRYCM